MNLASRFRFLRAVKPLISKRNMASLPAETHFTFRSASIKATGNFGVNIDDALKSSHFQAWKGKIEADKEFDLRSVHFQSVDMFGPRVGFVKFVAEVYKAGVEHCLPGICFSRGGAVGVLVILECDGKEYALCVVQSRVPIALSNSVEIPAGMLDGDGHFAGVAAKEMEEETGLKISEDRLVDLTHLAYGDKFPGMYPSAGGSDEFVRLFLYRERVTAEKLVELQGRCTGLVDHGEVITLKIIELSSLWRESSHAIVLSALFLYNQLTAEGKL